LPKLAFLYLDHVLRFFDKSNFKGWPDKIESVTYHWGKDKQRFIDQVKEKKIEVLIGNIPATAYETFRDITRALPQVQFIPSLDSQFSNKSKENVTHFCKKYNFPIPKTYIFYSRDQAEKYLTNTAYPKIIKKSYGPSNYGGYYVHKVDSFTQAKKLLDSKKYFPVYIQDFIPMAADIRVMLIGHQPVCAFWRHPPQGGWLTNTSQGGAMDYQAVPRDALDLAVKVSKAAHAEYWACDIAVGKDGQYRILECATAFAAFSYIRDWIGQYLMWKLSPSRFKKPYIPLYNWEELGKIKSSLLRGMRHINFSQNQLVTINDTCETFKKMSPNGYPFSDTVMKNFEEWPSETWNIQGNYLLRLAGLELTSVNAPQGKFEAEMAEDEIIKDEINKDEIVMENLTLPLLSEVNLYNFFAGVKGIGRVLTKNILDAFSSEGLIDALVNDPQKLTQVKNIKQKKLNHIIEHWESERKTVFSKARQ
jgi:hypothetical protein